MFILLNITWLVETKINCSSDMYILRNLKFVEIDSSTSVFEIRIARLARQIQTNFRLYNSRLTITYIRTPLAHTPAPPHTSVCIDRSRPGY